MSIDDIQKEISFSESTNFEGEKVLDKITVGYSDDGKWICIKPEVLIEGVVEDDGEFYYSPCMAIQLAKALLDYAEGMFEPEEEEEEEEEEEKKEELEIIFEPDGELVNYCNDCDVEVDWDEAVGEMLAATCPNCGAYLEWEEEEDDDEEEEDDDDDSGDVEVPVPPKTFVG